MKPALLTANGAGDHVATCTLPKNIAKTESYPFSQAKLSYTSCRMIFFVTLLKVKSYAGKKKEKQANKKKMPLTLFLVELRRLMQSF